MRNFFKGLLFFLILIISSGCYRVVQESQNKFEMDPVEKKALMAECKEINSNGNILELLAEIKRETREAFAILESGEIEERARRLEEIAASIDKKAAKVIALSKYEWSVEKWDYQGSWLIDKEDFKGVIGTHLPKGFRITDSEIQDIYFAGNKRTDLISNLSMDRNGREVVVRYKARGTSLELCQLNKTLMVILQVKYRNVTNNNERYFNLTLD